MLNRLLLQNFKSARDLDIALAPLSILTGLNGSGKSTALQAIALLQQSLNSLPEASTQLYLRGPLVQLGLSGDILSDNASSNTISIGVGHGNGMSRWQIDYVANADVLPMRKVLGARRKAPLPNPDFQYLQADRLVPSTLYPRANFLDRESGFLGTSG